MERILINPYATINHPINKGKKYASCLFSRWSFHP
jgi:hypothetical protein